MKMIIFICSIAVGMSFIIYGFIAANREQSEIGAIKLIMMIVLAVFWIAAQFMVLCKLL